MESQDIKGMCSHKIKPSAGKVGLTGTTRLKDACLRVPADSYKAASV